MPPGTIATEFCSRRSPRISSPASFSTVLLIPRSRRFALNASRSRGPRSEQQTKGREIMALTISVNGESEPLTAETLAALVAVKAEQTNRTGIAVALNGAVVPRTAWEATALLPGDRIEIVRVLQGG